MKKITAFMLIALLVVVMLPATALAVNGIEQVNISKAEFDAEFNASEMVYQDLSADGTGHAEGTNYAAQEKKFSFSGNSMQATITESADDLNGYNNLFQNASSLVVNNDANRMLISIGTDTPVYSICMGIVVTDEHGNYLSGKTITIIVNGTETFTCTTGATINDNDFVLTSSTPITSVSLFASGASSNTWAGLTYIALASEPLKDAPTLDFSITPENTAEVGTAVTLTADIDADATGTLVFKDGSAVLTTLDIESDGTVYTYTPAAGTHNYAVEYSGDATYLSASVTIEGYTITKKAQTSIPTIAVVGVTSDSVTVTDVTGAEYSIDNGDTWQDESVFENLSILTSYTILARYKETGTYLTGDTTTVTATTRHTSLDTTYVGGNSHNGAMFDVTVVGDKPVYIESFDYNAHESSEMVVYYKEGIYKGFEADADAWTLLGTEDVTTSAGRTPLNIGGALLFPGKTYGFYVTTTAADISIEYTNGDNTYTDSNIQIVAGTGLGYPFGNDWDVFTPRIFNGSIYYSLTEGPELVNDTEPLEAGYIGTDLTQYFIDQYLEDIDMDGLSIVLAATKDGQAVTEITAAGTYDVTLTYTMGTYSWDQTITGGIVVNKGTQTAPTVTATATKDTITINPIQDAEYSLDGQIWQDGNVFSGLMPNTAYTVYARLKGTDDYLVGDVGTLQITTLEEVPSPSPSPSPTKPGGVSNTGDVNDISLYILTLMLFGVVGLLLYRKRKRS